MTSHAVQQPRRAFVRNNKYVSAAITAFNLEKKFSNAAAHVCVCLTPLSSFTETLKSRHKVVSPILNALAVVDTNLEFKESLICHKSRVRQPEHLKNNFCCFLRTQN